ncbi:MAG: hypothetical protein TEF_06730 [Rhizobiales bacterium NRL2]|jgi:hypothetical protein|nr:MAG: hypothetical protein TEF_06730 [Rhizobiales bacterium NRL2]
MSEPEAEDRDAAAIAAIRRRQDRFLTETLPGALAMVNLEEADGPVPVEVAPGKDIFGRTCVLRVGGREWRFWFGLNVFRLFAIHFVPVDLQNPLFRAARERHEAEDFIDWLRRDVFAFTFGGAEKVGYDVNWEAIEVDGRRFVSVWAVALCETDFLERPELMLFWAQDLAMMTESFIRNAVRAELTFDPAVSPRPV